MKFAKKLAAAASLTALSASSFAAGSDPDLSTLTAAFNPTIIVTAIVALGVGLMTVYVAKKGISMVIAMIRG
jgi:lipopolysaccharide export LptBFGC system permease protein LptF